MDREGNVITKQDLERIVNRDDGQPACDLKIQFVLKVHFMTSEESENVKQTPSNKGLKGLT